MIEGNSRDSTDSHSQPQNVNVTPKKRGRRLKIFILISLLAAILIIVYVRTHPLVFMETHAHCIKIGGMELHAYAREKNNGKFPYHPKGYGNALLLLNEECYQCLTGPGYDAAPFHDAKKNGRELSEEECGRVYIQRLTLKSNSEIALLFDKLPTPGGDHCHLPYRLWASLGREVWTVGYGHIFVQESNWPEFAQKQVELLIKEGFEPKEAKRLYQLNTNP